MRDYHDPYSYCSCARDDTTRHSTQYTINNENQQPRCTSRLNSICYNDLSYMRYLQQHVRRTKDTWYNHSDIPQREGTP